MIIKVERIPVIHTFGELKQGALFAISDDTTGHFSSVYVKTDPIGYPDPVIVGSRINCVSILTGEWLRASDNMPVIPLTDVEVHAKASFETKGDTV